MIRFSPAQVRAYLDDDAVPTAVACSIHNRLVRQPVRAPNMPQVYESSALANWLRQSPTNPFSRLPLQAHDLQPAPDIHEAANRFCRLVNAECQRRAALPELSVAAALEVRHTGALHLCMRRRNARLRPPGPSAPAPVIGGTDDERTIAILEQLNRPPRTLYLARVRRP